MSHNRQTLEDVEACAAEMVWERQFTQQIGGTGVRVIAVLDAFVGMGHNVSGSTGAAPFTMLEGPRADGG